MYPMTVAEGGSDADTANTLEAIGGSNMAPFLTKLFQIVSAKDTDRCIQWTPKGDSFVITDPDGFARDILPTYFKHNNIRSFIRQLNTYGFRKRTNISSTDEHLEFFHPKFRRSEPALLTQIKRCHQQKPAQRQTGDDAGDSSVGGKQHAPDVEVLRQRVGELKSRLGSLQAEIREYNMQMEQKVNLLMHVLQTSAAPGGGAALGRVAAASNSAQPLPQQPGQVPQQHGQQHAALGMGLGASGGLQSTAAYGGMQPLSSTHADFLGRRDSLLASLSQQQLGGQLGGGLSGMGGAAGLSGLGLGSGGLANSLMGNFGSLGSLGAHKVAGVEGGALQHLLEAAQRYHTEDSSSKGGSVDAQHAAAKRFCAGDRPTTAPPTEPSNEVRA